MKIVILGVNGYLGRFIKAFCEKKDLDFSGINRDQVDFGSEDAYKNLCRILNDNNPKLIINCVGTIDGRNINPNDIFNSIFIIFHIIFLYHLFFIRYF